MQKLKIKNLIFFIFLLTVSFSIQLIENLSQVNAGCPNPSTILNLSNWKLTLPSGPSEKPTEVKQPQLNSYSNSSYFFTNRSCNGVVFKAPINSVTTKNSNYPRSELREMSNGGNTNASWSSSSGSHTMYIDQAITAVPKSKQHVVAGQIHDGSDDVIVIRLEHPKLFIDIDGKDGPVLDSQYTLGKRFNIRFLAENGQIKIFYNGGSTPAYTLNKSANGLYFKAGAYTQSNCTKEVECMDNNYGEVVIYSLQVNHSDSPITAQKTAPASPEALPKLPSVPPVSTDNTPTPESTESAPITALLRKLKLLETVKSARAEYKMLKTDYQTQKILFVPTQSQDHYESKGWQPGQKYTLPPI